MKSQLLAALVVLQLATLGVVVGLLLKGNGSSANPEIERLTQALRGAVNQERIIIQYLEELRARAAGRAASLEPPAEVGGTPSPADGPPEAGSVPGAALPSSPFPAATAALADLKRLLRDLKQEIESGSQNTRPIEVEIKRRRDALIARGHEAVFVVRREVDLQPFEPGRDPAFVEYLLAEIVPPLSSGAREDAFDIARGALVRATNEPQIKFAAARTLQAIDPHRWVKEVCDVVALGGGHEVDLRARLLGLFETSPRPEAVELAKRFVNDARQAPELRTRAVLVLARQDSSAVNPTLRAVLFEDPAPMLKILAFDALWERLKSIDEKRRLAEEVLKEDPSRMPEGVHEKARQLLATL